MRLSSRKIASSHATEVYLTAVPDLSAEPAAEAGRVLEAIQQEAERQGARILRQRVFVPEGWGGSPSSGA